MSKITFNEKTYDLNENETVLECLLRHGVDTPYSCQSGSCQSCMMRATEGTPPIEAQAGIKPTLQQQNYFLACICKPSSDLSLCAAGNEALPKQQATVIDKTPLSAKIMRLRLAPEQSLSFQPGQFINLHRDDGLTRSYSIASLTTEGFLELHIELIENGRMSSWIHNELEVGSSITIEGAHGDSFYLGGRPEQPLLLIGTGSGLSPLWGIARAALQQGHSGEIHIYHGSREPQKLYLMEELRQLATKHGNVRYTPCLSSGEMKGVHVGRAADTALSEHPSLSGWRVFLCGHPQMVNDTKRKAFLAGANFQDILADPFTINTN